MLASRTVIVVGIRCDDPDAAGDRVEVNWVPTGEHLASPFEVASGVVIKFQYAFRY